ncbi:MAG: helicase, partial [Chloroflexus aggregans]
NRYSRPPDRVPPRSNANRPQSITPVEPETPAAAAPSEEPTLPDAEAILARLRQRRSRIATETPRRSESPASGNPTFEPRFQPGDRIICMPYGAGKVRLSLVNGDREILIVDFDEHGELRIDPSVSVVRRLPPEERHNSVEE